MPESLQYPQFKIIKTKLQKKQREKGEKCTTFSSLFVVNHFYKECLVLHVNDRKKRLHKHFLSFLMCVGASKAHQMLQAVRHLLVPHHQTQSQCHPHVCFFWFHNFFYNWKLFSFLICDGTFKVQEMLLKPSCQTPTICAQTTRQNVNVTFILLMSENYFEFHDFPMADVLCSAQPSCQTPNLQVAHQQQDTMSLSPFSCQRVQKRSRIRRRQYCAVEHVMAPHY